MYKDLKDKEGAVIVDGMSRFIPSSAKFFFPHSFLLKLNLSFLIIHGSIVLILWPFRLETVPIGCGKILVLLSLANFHSAKNRCRNTLRRAKLAFIKGK